MKGPSKPYTDKAFKEAMSLHLHVCCPPVKAVSTDMLLQGGPVVCEPPAQRAIPSHCTLPIRGPQAVKRS